MDTEANDRYPLELLVDLATQVEPGVGVTIDLEASEVLGHPMVVVRLPQRVSPDPRFEALTPREREVAELLAEGLRNKAIAARLFITVATVKDHVHNILRKTGLSSRTAVGAAWLNPQ